MDEIVSTIKSFFNISFSFICYFYFFSLKESFYSLTQTLNKNHDDSAKKIKERWLQKSTCKFLLINNFTYFK